jgi:hypothetical protein
MSVPKSRITACVVAFGLAALAAPAAFADPPGRVARLSFIGGGVSLRPASVDDWTNALINYPVTAGDHLWIDRGGRAELQVGTTAVRLASSTEASVLTLDDRTLQLRLTEGSIAARVRALDQEQAIEIDTPNGSIDLIRPGFYRIDVNEAGDQTIVTVRSGEAEATAPGAAFAVHAQEGAELDGIDATQVNGRAAGPTDAFEDWCLTRDRRADAAAATRYVSPAMVGYEDLDQYGTWQPVAAYGTVWVPRVQAGWVPYRDGRWVWIDPWGWTWVDAAPWGFAPFHYGRWVYLPSGWAWVPGTIVARPVYAPALVAFVGGAGWHASLTVSQPVAWFPLGPREPFIPVYRVTPEYVRAVNITHVTVTNVTVTNITYVNRAVPGAVTAVPREAFVAARPVAAVAVAVPGAAIGQATVVGSAALVAPERTSVVASASGRVAAPPPAVVERKVVVRRAPQPIAVAFDDKVRVLQQHPGVPLDEATGQTLRAQHLTVDQHPLVRATAAAPQPPAPAAPRPQRQVQSQPAGGTLEQGPAVNHPAGNHPAAGNGALAERHATELAALDARQAQERNALLKHHQQLEAHAATEQDRAHVHQRNEQETHKVEQRQQKEREALQKKQENERVRDRSGSGG